MSKEKNGEGNEEERWRVAFSRCRTCDHTKFLHSTLAEGFRCMDAVPNNAKQVRWCKCKGFIPADNLEYLEWKYQQKKGKKK